jgi:polysaccharide biosynthesis PFTS motif protein
MSSILKRLQNLLNPTIVEPEIYSLKSIKHVLKGYAFLKANNYNLVNNIKKELENISYKLDDDNYKIAYNQFLFFNLYGTRLNSKILKSLSNDKSIAFPLPLNWIYVLKNNGLNVSKFRSFILFNLLAIYKFFQFLFYFIQFLFYNQNSHKNYIYFFNLRNGTLPNSENKNKFNIINWYNTWDFKNTYTDILHNYNKNDYNYNGYNIIKSNYIPKLSVINKFIVIPFYTIIYIFKAFIKLFFGDPSKLLFIKEVFLDNIFKLSNTNYLANDYLFNNENHIYRPLWSYTAQRKKSRIIYYNWAASFPDFEYNNQYNHYEIGEKTQTWQYILQWSKSYGNYIQSKLVYNISKVLIVPPIYYSDSNTDFILPNNKYICVFDVIPQKKYFHDVFISTLEYRTYINSFNFLNDIYEVALKYNYTIVWKGKRDLVSNHSNSYRKLINNFINRPNVYAIDPNISAFKIINNSNLVISMPFTSPAFIANQMNIKSIFYDPSENISLNDRGAQGLLLIQGKSRLDNYIQNISNEF